MKRTKKTAKEERLGQALVLIDVINDFDFPRAEALLRYARPAARRIAALKDRAKRRRLPVIYANDEQFPIGGEGVAGWR